MGYSKQIIQVMMNDQLCIETTGDDWGFPILQHGRSPSSTGVPVNSS